MTAHEWETTNSKPPGSIISLANQKTRTSSQIIFITFFPSRCTAMIAFFEPQRTITFFPSRCTALIAFFEPQQIIQQIITVFPSRCTVLIAFLEPQQTVQICLLKIIFPIQSCMFWLFFIQFLLCRVPYWGPLGMLFYRLHDVSWPCSLRNHLWAGRSEILLSS